MTEATKPNGIENLALNTENLNRAVAVFHYVSHGTLSIMYIPDDGPPGALNPFNMDPIHRDDKMLIGTSKNAGSLVQLLSLLCGLPFYKVTNDHLTSIHLELFVRYDHLEDVRFRDYRNIAGPMGY